MENKELRMLREENEKLKEINTCLKNALIEKVKEVELYKERYKFNANEIAVFRSLSKSLEQQYDELYTAYKVLFDEVNGGDESGK